MQKVVLNNGLEMPILEFGVFQVTDLKIPARVAREFCQSGCLTPNPGSGRGVSSGCRSSEIPRRISGLSQGSCCRVPPSCRTA